MSPAHVGAGVQRGFIIPVGGAEEKLDRPAILKRFLKLSGGSKARIAIIPTASLAADTGERYEAIFDELGAYKAESLAFEERGDGEENDLQNACQAHSEPL